ncbi:hypothetical protein [Sphaerisporangium sp. TRM90804]|uniref:hypothetical protein n=1 Tax=Sphaerisporangium sp. TRM90804 TaxID=3031113 RepID=UPI00244688C8|nr:hypothetical protein [Sphaerisporangium sp. TRM90804]MDH2426923.1 hypothetical protein [Sphaerisporangium sp. TRM90804]
MSALTYTVLTDPTSLEASVDGRTPSTGTIYLMVTNTGEEVAWLRIEVRVPVGDGAGRLTREISSINLKGEYTDTLGTQTDFGVEPDTRPVNIQQQGANVLEITPESGRIDTFESGDYMLLTLENVTVAPTAGVPVLMVREILKTDTGWETKYAAVPLVKATAKEIPPPRDFRPDKAMLDTGENLTLSWDGSPDLTYEIVFPGGRSSVSGGTWSPPTPQRATTYILVATDPITAKQHFLTTTVQVRHPVLESLTATEGIDTPWVEGTAHKGRVTFTDTGVEIFDNTGGQGTVTADKALFNGVNTGWVQGRSPGDGKIAFPEDGIDVRQGSGGWGTVHADKADVNGVNTKWVQGRHDDDGWISFPKEGLNVYRAGTHEWGTVFAKHGRMATGKTPPGQGWRTYAPDSICIDVDTSAGEFTGHPVYLTSIGGAGGMQYDLVGTSAVYDITAHKFSVYLKWRDDRELTPAMAQQFGWYINWIGYDAP